MAPAINIPTHTVYCKLRLRLITYRQVNVPALMKFLPLHTANTVGETDESDTEADGPNAHVSAPLQAIDGDGRRNNGYGIVLSGSCRLSLVLYGVVLFDPCRLSMVSHGVWGGCHWVPLPCYLCAVCSSYHLAHSHEQTQGH